MKNILFATAHSAFSKNTWKYVLRLAQHFGATVTLLHVFEEPSPIFAGDGIMEEFANGNMDKFKAEQHKREVEKLRAFAQDKPKQYHSVITKGLVRIDVGGIANTILKEEQTGKYDLLVLGTATKAKLINRILGSVSKSIVNESNTPVFLVPPSGFFRGINKIAYATNFKYDDIGRMNRLLEWMKVFDAELHLLHVYEKDNEKSDAIAKMNRLMTHFQGTGAKLHHELIKGKVIDSIRNYMSLTKMRMIALNTHKRGMLAQLFQASETDELAFESAVPVLVFK